MKYTRRTDEDRIAELNAKIAGIQERAIRRAARADPVHQQARIALRALEKALREKPDETPLVLALMTAREAIRGSLESNAPRPTAARAPRVRRMKSKEPSAT